jgi:hypothetical protein
LIVFRICCPHYAAYTWQPSLYSHSGSVLYVCVAHFYCGEHKKWSKWGEMCITITVFRKKNNQNNNRL